MKAEKLQNRPKKAVNVFPGIPDGTVRWRITGLVGLLGISLAIVWDAWADIFRISMSDEEEGYVLLAPLILAWFAWIYRDDLAPRRWQGSLLGTAIAASGCFLCFKFPYHVYAYWHTGAVLLVLGVLLTFWGWRVAQAVLPGLAALVFLIPIPTLFRQQAALPLQTITAWFTQSLLQLFGVAVDRSGNLLILNGQPVTITDACNGLRMAMTLFMVCYVVAFTWRIHLWERLLLLVASPLIAIVCNVIRLVPTIWVYGHQSQQVAEHFHAVAGWVMLVIAFLLSVGLVRLLRWMGVAAPIGGGLQSQDVRVEPLRWAAPALTMGVLVFGGTQALLRVKPENADAYHSAIREAAARVPQSVGDWVASDVPLSNSAVAMLRPNIILSRRYLNTFTGHKVSFLLVQCDDARGLVGHYPPVCYVGNGCRLASETVRDWQVGALKIEGMEYAFETKIRGTVETFVVYNVIILPDGRFMRDMAAIREAAADVKRRFYGAAQLQLVSGKDLSVEERDGVFRLLIESDSELIEKIRSGSGRITK